MPPPPLRLTFCVPAMAKVSDTVPPTRFVKPVNVRVLVLVLVYVSGPVAGRLHVAAAFMPVSELPAGAGPTTGS